MLALVPAECPAQTLINGLRFDGRGRISGVIRMNSTEVVVPFDQAARLVRSLRHGDPVGCIIDAAGLRSLMDRRPERDGGVTAARHGGPRTEAQTDADLLTDLRSLAWRNPSATASLWTHDVHQGPTGAGRSGGGRVPLVPGASLALAALRAGTWVEGSRGGVRDAFGLALRARPMGRPDPWVGLTLERVHGARQPAPLPVIPRVTDRVALRDVP